MEGRRRKEEGGEKKIAACQMELAFNSCCGRARVSARGRSDRSGSLFEGMLTRRQRGSPPAFLLRLHQLSFRQQHVTQSSRQAELSGTFHILLALSE